MPKNKLKHIELKGEYKAFLDAVVFGRLTAKPEAGRLFVGNWMYMGTRDGRAIFKHVETGEYLP